MIPLESKNECSSVQRNRGDWHLKITFENLVFGTMSKKIVNIVSSILLLLPLLVGVLASSDLPISFFSSSEICPGNNYGEVILQKPCDMDHCNPHIPRCPLCPSSSSIVPYLHQSREISMQSPSSSFILTTLDPLFDQGFLRSVFRPPPLPPLEAPLASWEELPM